MLTVERSALTQGVLIPGTLYVHGGLKSHIHRLFYVGNPGGNLIRQSLCSAGGGAHFGHRWIYPGKPFSIGRGKFADDLGLKRGMCASMEVGRQKKPPLVREVRLTDLSTQAARGGGTSPKAKLSSQDHAALTGDKGPTKLPVPSSAEAEDEPLLASRDLEVSGAWHLPRRKAEVLLFLVPLLWGENIARHVQSFVLC
jgi:hypothetical protein